MHENNIEVEEIKTKRKKVVSLTRTEITKTPAELEAQTTPATATTNVTYSCILGKEILEDWYPDIQTDYLKITYISNEEKIQVKVLQKKNQVFFISTSKLWIFLGVDSDFDVEDNRQSPLPCVLMNFINIITVLIVIYLDLVSIQVDNSDVSAVTCTDAVNTNIAAASTTTATTSTAMVIDGTTILAQTSCTTTENDAIMTVNQMSEQVV